MPHARVANVPIEDRAAYSLGEVAGLIGMSISGLYLLIGRVNFNLSELVVVAWSLAKRLTTFCSYRTIHRRRLTEFGDERRWSSSQG